jgi:hypothetical protein
MDTHALTWPKEGNARVPYRVFSDPDIYKAELDAVLGELHAERHSS